MSRTERDYDDLVLHSHWQCRNWGAEQLGIFSEIYSKSVSNLAEELVSPDVPSFQWEWCYHWIWRQVGDNRPFLIIF